MVGDVPRLLWFILQANVGGAKHQEDSAAYAGDDGLRVIDAKHIDKLKNIGLVEEGAHVGHGSENCDMYA